jgi:L-rhamnose mutarotase
MEYIWISGLLLLFLWSVITHYNLHLDNKDDGLYLVWSVKRTDAYGVLRDIVYKTLIYKYN